MKTLRNIFTPWRNFIAALLLLTVTACDTSEIADCFDGILVRVVVKTTTTRDVIDENAPEDVVLYVFDENEILLDIRPTRTGNVEKLYFSKAKKLNIAATANTDEGVDMTALEIGATRLGDVEIALRQTAQYLTHAGHEHPGDIFVGTIRDIDNSRQTSGVIELPLKRKIAAVTVRVKGLKEYLNAPEAKAEDFAIALSGKYNSLNLDGKPGTTGSQSGYPVSHKLGAAFRTMFGNDYLEAPPQITADKTDYIRVLSTDEGSPVSIDIYHHDVAINNAPITTAADGNPIIIENGHLNVVEIAFTQSGAVTVKIKQAGWNGYVEIEKDF